MIEVEKSHAMREGMRRLASGVSVISCLDQEGQPYAMTATSVTSVSDAPASLLVCVNRSARAHDAITASGHFAVNVLSRDQDGISNLCAGGEEGKKRFELGHWQGFEQLPFLSDCLAVFKCQVDHSMDYGTHRIFIGLINQVLVGDPEHGDPLIYLNGQYRGLL